MFLPMVEAVRPNLRIICFPEPIEGSDQGIRGIPFEQQGSVTNNGATAGGSVGLRNILERENHDSASKLVNHVEFSER